MKNKITKIPISYDTRLKNQLGKGAVPCLVSERWLKFSTESSLLQDGEYVSVDVMTKDKNDNQRKICELIIKKEDIVDAIQSIKPRKNAQQ